MVTETLPKSWPQFVNYVKGGKLIGRDGRIRVTHFLDLLSAAHSDPILFELRDILIKCISKRQKSEYVAVVAPKKGNVLLAKEVGRSLNKRTASVRDNVLFDKWFDGELRSGELVVMVDDIASDGEFFRDAIINLRRLGIHTDAVYAIVDRAEGDCAEVLKEEGIRYEYVYRLDDGHLGRLRSGDLSYKPQKTT